MTSHSQTIFVSGHQGLVGSALLRRLRSSGHYRLLAPSRQQLDLCDQHAVRDYLAREHPDYVFIAAGLVGGILANNTRRAEFIHRNLMIAANLIDGAHQAGVQRLMYFGSSCIYPRNAAQPMSEEALLSGSLEPTNEPYAIAKIAGLKLAESYNRQYGRQYVSVMPTNLYGPNDNYDLEQCHVLPALIRKVHEAKLSGAGEMVVWGTGTPRREFLYVDDLADACVHLFEREYDGPLINIGCGEDVSIAALTEQVMEVVGFDGRIVFDTSKPDGMPRKLLDVSRLNELGWKARTPLKEGIRRAYADFCARHEAALAH
ncbi:MAG TPA: GDP-L-fucose synthase [Burkholderiaceae bacterium]|nr:GDP-L-fucose synthase [Burkholderiaceae bacterium]